MFLSLTCGKCHRVGDIGSGDIGPDLTRVGTRFSYKDILEAIINPSKSISSQYANRVFHLKNSETVIGKLIRDDQTNYYVSQNPFAQQNLRKIPKSEVRKVTLSNTSVMPPALINRLNADELKDLLAFLKSGGNENNDVFKNKK
jgi:putative heme-binding domain-containing protein